MEGIKTVLIVEDDVVLQELFRRIIESSDEFTALVHQGPFEKVPTSVDWSSIDVVLCDQYLGSVRGSKILEWLETNQPQVRRVLLTGDSMINPRGLHCELLCFKPVFTDELLSSLTRTERG